MEYTIETKFPNQMLLANGELCISIYMPTHRMLQNNKQDSLVFKNLVKEAELSLEKLYSTKEISPLMTLLNKLKNDVNFWNHSLDGLAVFATLDAVIIYRIKKDLEPIAIVSKGFHIKPLIEYFQGLETFSILALEANSFALYEGNHLDIKTIELPSDVETTLSGVLGTQHSDSYLTTHGGNRGSNDAVFHGHGGKSDDKAIDQEKFFRYVDNYVLENISKKNHYPLLLVTKKEHNSDFRNVSINPYLIENSIDGSYDTFQESEILNELKRIFKDRFLEKVNKDIERFNSLKDKNLSTDQIKIIVKALLESRVDTLFLEKNKIISGRIDENKRNIITGDLDNPVAEDLLNDMIKHAFLSNSIIIILDKEQMPSTSGAAAILRY